jgi:hypothetical protein
MMPNPSIERTCYGEPLMSNVRLLRVLLSMCEVNMAKISSPWASGPGEILKHGLELLQEDSDTKRRLAMISIDNAVELMIKIYLGLPQRITGLKISRKDYQEFSESFPLLLDALQKYASNKLDGIDLGEIEWYHRLRNQLYHQGNGLTVERDKVEVYAELANLLFNNLFGVVLVEPEDDGTRLLGSFMAAWVEFEQTLGGLLPAPEASGPRRPPIPLDALRHVQAGGLLSSSDLAQIQEIRRLRNEVVHGVVNHQSAITKDKIVRLREITQRLSAAIQSTQSKQLDDEAQRN